MPSFDLVSDVDMGELKNALNQASREISSRYDFKGSKASIELMDKIIELKAEDEYKIGAALDILRTKMAKRNIGMNSVEAGEVKPTGNQMFKQVLTINQGIDKEQAKKINKIIKGFKIKVSSAILDEKLRITGKKIDDLQETFRKLKEHNDIKIELQMDNMKT